jgi:hypothetical protein
LLPGVVHALATESDPEGRDQRSHCVHAGSSGCEAVARMEGSHFRGLVIREWRRRAGRLAPRIALRSIRVTGAISARRIGWMLAKPIMERLVRSMGFALLNPSYALI